MQPDQGYTYINCISGWSHEARGNCFFRCGMFYSLHFYIRTIKPEAVETSDSEMSLTLNKELLAFQIKSARCDKHVRWNSPMLALPHVILLDSVHLPFFVRQLPLRAVRQPSFKIQFDFSCCAAWLLLCRDYLITSC